MATAYHPVEMSVNIMTSGAGGGTVPHHHHHHHHHHHSHLQQRNDELLFADEPHQYYETGVATSAAATAAAPTVGATATPATGPSDYYSPQPIYGHGHMAGIEENHHHQHNHPHQSHHNGPAAADSCVFHRNDHTGPTATAAAHHIMTAMAAEDGYWGSPCSSDSTTNGRDYSPSDTSLTNRQPSSASPQYLLSPHQYAPVYYPPQYDRPELVYDDTAAAGTTVAGTGGYYTADAVDGTATNCDPNAADGIDSTSTASCQHHQHNQMVTAGGQSEAANRVVPFVRVVKRRTTANKKERRRTQSINSAFTFLRDCIPNVPSDTKLSKIKTLRLATSYISYLTRVLEGDQDPSGGFRAELVPSSRKINAERRAKYEAQGLSLEDIGALCLSSSNTCSADSTATATQKKAKGRTGWPQHVWASELKQEQ